MHVQAGNIASLPFNGKLISPDIVDELVEISKKDWNNFELSWDFEENPIIHNAMVSDKLINSYGLYKDNCIELSERSLYLEIILNDQAVNSLSLFGKFQYQFSLDEVALNSNPSYRYSPNFGAEQREARLKSDTMRELISYAVGCMLGRYSLAEPGLIYAHSGGVGFDPSRYGAFPADDDGIIPITEEKWFPDDDAATRIEEFLGIAWPDAPVMETLTTLMDGLSMDKAGEPRAALRSYLSKQFYKDHLQTYKNRPIYWLFSSGKQKAFEALVYLHRYNEGTLARMRTEYVMPLMGKLQQRMADLQAEHDASSSSAEKTRKNREKDKLAKQVVELRAFDEELRHFADQRISLDLDDGVKVNYARFGDLLAFKDKVCPKKKDGDE